MNYINNLLDEENLKVLLGNIHSEKDYNNLKETLKHRHNKLRKEFEELVSKLKHTNK